MFFFFIIVVQMLVGSIWKIYIYIYKYKYTYNCPPFSEMHAEVESTLAVR